MRKKVVSLLFFLWLITIYSIHSQCFQKNDVFGDGERLRYTVSYNWGPVWVDAGLVTFSVSKETYLGKPVWHFKSTGKTFASYDLLFKVRDYFDAWTDIETFRPMSFRRYVYEGAYTLLNTLEFNNDRQKVYSGTKSKDNPQRSDTLSILHCSFDMLTSIYYTRTLNFSGFAPGTRQKVKVLIDDAYYDINIKVVGKEIVETPDEQKFRCVKFAATMVQGTIFKEDEDALIWVTDDENKVPVYIEAKIIVGTVKAYLKDTRNLKNKMSALIE